MVRRPVIGPSGCILNPSPHPANKKRKYPAFPKHVCCLLLIIQVACQTRGTNNFSYISDNMMFVTPCFPSATLFILFLGNHWILRNSFAVSEEHCSQRILNDVVNLSSLLCRNVLAPSSGSLPHKEVILQEGLGIYLWLIDNNISI